MARDDGQPITCRECGETKPAQAFYRCNGRRLNSCKACDLNKRRARYHGDPLARAMQISRSILSHVRRSFPSAETGMSHESYAQRLLEASNCDYCGQPNDGTHPFNLDHVVPLALGGLHSLENLVPCCEPCNRAKRDMPAEDYRAWLRGVSERLKAG